jgi:hypothetical protein
VPGLGPVALNSPDLCGDAIAIAPEPLWVLDTLPRVLPSDLASRAAIDARRLGVEPASALALLIADICGNGLPRQRLDRERQARRGRQASAAEFGPSRLLPSSQTASLCHRTTGIKTPASQLLRGALKGPGSSARLSVRRSERRSGPPQLRERAGRPRPRDHRHQPGPPRASRGRVVSTASTTET